jgi:uncharacterized protein YoxC
MSPAEKAVILVCVVALTAVIIVTLLALRRVAHRAETVLELVERDLRPTMNRVNALTDDVRALTQEAKRELERVGAVTKRVDDLSSNLARVSAIALNVTRIGQAAGLATALKRGLGVFAARLRK